VVGFLFFGFVVVNYVTFFIAAKDAVAVISLEETGLKAFEEQFPVSSISRRVSTSSLKQSLGDGAARVVQDGRIIKRASCPALRGGTVDLNSSASRTLMSQGSRSSRSSSRTLVGLDSVAEAAETYKFIRHSILGDNFVDQVFTVAELCEAANLRVEEAGVLAAEKGLSIPDYCLFYL